jgi:hypothetical protein
LLAAHAEGGNEVLTFDGDHLNDLCREWQRVLRLQDWDVQVKIARGFQLGKRQGECEYVQSLRQAVIRILDPNDWPDQNWPQDIEATLVHELLHLHFAPFMSDAGEDDLINIAQEVAIDQIAKALVKQQRQIHRLIGG